MVNAVAVRGVDDVVVETVEVVAQPLGRGVDVVKEDPRSLQLLSSPTVDSGGQLCGITLLPTRAGA